MALKNVVRSDDFVIRPRSRRASLVARGVLAVRRSAGEMKRNAEIDLITKSSTWLGRNYADNHPAVFAAALGGAVGVDGFFRAEGRYGETGGVDPTVDQVGFY